MPFEIDLRQAVYALADALDLVGIDEVQHGKRVAFMALECGRLLGMEPTVQRSLFHAALLHDCGVSSTRTHQRLLEDLDWEGTAEHCDAGYTLLKEFAPLGDLADIVHLHHTRWHHLPGDVDPQTARLANLIFLADRVDALAAPHYGGDILKARGVIQARVQKLAGDFFDPELVAVFLELSASEAFWFSLEPRHLALFLREMEGQHQPVRLGAAAMRHFAAMFARIVDAKSRFTEEHSEGVARLARRLGG